MRIHLETAAASSNERPKTDAEGLPELFTQLVTLNGCAAILAGLLATATASAPQLTFTELSGAERVFVASGLIFLVGTLAVGAFFTENYGDAVPLASSASAETQNDHWQRSLQVIQCDRRIWILATTQILFEGSMYCFVLLWSPMLRAAAAASLPSSSSSSAVPLGEHCFFSLPFLLLFFRVSVSVSVCL